MAGSTESRFMCQICGKPIHLEVDLYTDEDGQPVHQECYARKTAKKPNPPRTETKSFTGANPTVSRT